MSDLRGQYKINYTTLRRQGRYAAGIEVDLPTTEGVLETAALNVEEFFGPDNVGRLSYDPPSLNMNTSIAQVFIRGVRIPRNIDRFRFKIETDKSHEAEIVAREDGGLLAGWGCPAPTFPASSMLRGLKHSIWARRAYCSKSRCQTSLNRGSRYRSPSTTQSIVPRRASSTWLRYSSVSDFRP